MPQNIKVKFVHAGFGDVTPKEVAANTTVGDFLQSFNIEKGSGTAVRINGVEKEDGYVLQDNDSICLSPRSVKAA
jgi:hypothetical protein